MATMTTRTDLSASRPPSSSATVSDDERAARIARLQASRGASGSAPSPGTATPAAPARRQHPAKGARALALFASVAATGVIGTGLAFADHLDASQTVSTGSALGATTTAAATGTGSTGIAATVGSTTATTAVAATAPATATPVTATTAPATATTAARTATTAAATATTAAAANAKYADGTFPGAVVTNRWGNVQVKVTITGGSITAVRTVQLPTDNKSVAINNRATPTLEAEAIAVQGANIDIVSGATYTSRGYATSLQSALDAAAVAVSAKAAA